MPFIRYNVCDECGMSLGHEGEGLLGKQIRVGAAKHHCWNATQSAELRPQRRHRPIDHRKRTPNPGIIRRHRSTVLFIEPLPRDFAPLIRSHVRKLSLDCGSCAILPACSHDVGAGVRPTYPAMRNKPSVSMTGPMSLRITAPIAEAERPPSPWRSVRHAMCRSSRHWKAHSTS